MNQSYSKIYIGPMFAGKTSAMCDAVERFRIANKKCVMVKHKDDTRYNADSIVTHKGHQLTIKTIVTDDLASVYTELSKYEVVGVDEVQFFNDAVEIIDELVRGDTIVISAGLDADFKGAPFGRINELIAMSEYVIKLQAVCHKCYADASFTERITDNLEVKLIGGHSMYNAVCRKCWVKNK